MIFTTNSCSPRADNILNAETTIRMNVLDAEVERAVAPRVVMTMVAVKAVSFRELLDCPRTRQAGNPCNQFWVHGFLGAWMLGSQD